VSCELAPSQNPAPRFTTDQVRALLERARNGDESCLPELHRLLDTPKVKGRAWDLAALIRGLSLKTFFRKNLYNRERTARQMNQLQAALLNPGATEIERLLVERVVAGWLRVQEAELRLAVTPAGDSGMALKRADAADRRYLAALRALAAIRQLARPALQVNIGEQQVNVSG
jgi:hypothetical protein